MNGNDDKQHILCVCVCERGELYGELSQKHRITNKKFTAKSLPSIGSSKSKMSFIHQMRRINYFHLDFFLVDVNLVDVSLGSSRVVIPCERATFFFPQCFCSEGGLLWRCCFCLAELGVLLVFCCCCCCSVGIWFVRFQLYWMIGAVVYVMF